MRNSLGSLQTLFYARSLGLVFALALVACSRPAEKQGALVLLRLPSSATTSATPNVSATSGPLQVSSATTPGWDTTSPSSVSEIGCYAIFVSYGGANNICHGESSSTLFSYAQFGGFYAAGSLIEIEVASGPARTIYLLGARLVSGTCQRFSVNERPTYANYSNPYLLAQTTLDLFPGTTAVNLAPTANFSAATKLVDCTTTLNTGQGGGISPTATPTPAIGSLVFDNPSQPTNLNFGQTQDTTFVVTNTGATSAVLGAATIAGSPMFSVMGSSTCSTGLSPGGTCTVVVRYAPGSLGSATGTLNLPYTVSAVGFSATKSLSASAVAGTTNVLDLYSANGANWMSYVVNDGADMYTSSGAACPYTGTSWRTCWHAGEFRKVIVPGVSTCSGLTISDSLDVFDWECKIFAGPEVAFVSTNLKAGKGLKDLVSDTAWLSNSITVQLSGTTVLTSFAVPWWSNPVSALPAYVNTTTPESLSPGDSGTIFTFSISRVTHGLHFPSGANNIAVVSLSGATLTWDGSLASGNGCSSIGGTNGSNRCMIYTAGSNGHWFEVNLDGEGGTNDAQYGIFTFDSSFVRVHNSSITRLSSTLGAGFVDLTGTSKSNRLTDLVLSTAQSQSIGLNLGGDGGNLVRNVKLASTGAKTGTSGAITVSSSNNDIWESRIVNTTTSAGILIPAAKTNNTIYDAVISNTAAQSILVQSGGNRILKVLATNSADNGLTIHTTAGATANNVLSHLTIAQHPWQGIYLNTSGGNIVHHALLANNLEGIETVGVNGTTNNFLGSIASLNFTNNAIANATGHLLTLQGPLLATSASCLSGGAGTGITVGCGPANSSTHTLIPGLSSAGTFFGKSIADDAMNVSDNGSGQATYSLTMDWLNFSYNFMTWGKFNAAAYPSTAHHNRCVTGTCQVWDWRLRSTDTVVYDRSGSGASPNDPFVNGASCPSAIDGNLTYSMNSQTFLRNALEIVTDTIGDNDGLCEANESCIYSPNFGAYQGHGDYTNNICSFANGGTVVGVTMYAFPANGY